MNNRRTTDTRLHKATKLTEVVVLWATLIGIIFGGYFFIDEWKTDKKETRRIETELKQEILDTDIDRNAKIRDHYDKIEMERPLSPAEESRRKYVIERMERQYIKQERLEKIEDELE